MLRNIFKVVELVLLVIASIFVFTQFMLLDPFHEKIANVPFPAKASTPSTLYVLINKERETRGLKPLTISPQLEKSAALKACDMRDRHYFNHIDPDGKEAWVWFSLVGYRYTNVGENIGQNLATDIVAHRRFMVSQTHRENILSPHYTDIGVARCGRYLVEHFGSVGIP